MRNKQRRPPPPSEIRAAPGRIVYGPNRRLPHPRSPIEAVNHNCPCPNDARRPALSGVSESLADPLTSIPDARRTFQHTPTPPSHHQYIHTLRTPQSPKSRQAEPPKAKPPPPPPPPSRNHARRERRALLAPPLRVHGAQAHVPRPAQQLHPPGACVCVLWIRALDPCNLAHGSISF